LACDIMVNSADYTMETTASMRDNADLVQEERERMPQKKDVMQEEVQECHPGIRQQKRAKIMVLRNVLVYILVVDFVS